MTDTADTIVKHIKGLLPSTQGPATKFYLTKHGAFHMIPCGAQTREGAQAELDRARAIRAKQIADGVLTEAAPEWVLVRA